MSSSFQRFEITGGGPPRAPATGRDINLAFVGPPKSGKTYAMSELRFHRAQTIYIDITGEVRAPYESHDAGAVSRAVGSKPCVHVVWLCGHLMSDPKKMLAGLKAIGSAAERHHERVTLIFDEVGAFKDHGHKDAINYVCGVGRTGRQKSVSVWAGSHRPQEMPPNLNAILDETWYTGCGNAADYDFLRRYVGDKEIVVAVKEVTKHRAATGEFPFVRRLHSGADLFRRGIGQPEWTCSPDGNWCVIEQLGEGTLGRPHD